MINPLDLINNGVKIISSRINFILIYIFNNIRLEFIKQFNVRKSLLLHFLKHTMQTLHMGLVSQNLYLS